VASPRRPCEAPLRGYLVAPPTGAESAPGVVLIHEWWGLNDNIRAMADRLADAGYRALAVDMYGGQAAETPEGARALMEAAMADPSAGVAILERAVAFLREGGAPQVGTIGWCFGGGWSLRAGLTQGEAVDAVVVYYGHVPTEASELASLQAPLIGFFGAEDGGIPVADVRAFEAALQANEARAEIHVYEGAGHAFANPSGANYQAAPAQDSWARTLAFFAEHLGGSAAEAPPQ
jgi:carboxymethylenebutenolidase